MRKRGQALPCTVHLNFLGPIPQLAASKDWALPVRARGVGAFGAYLPMPPHVNGPTPFGSSHGQINIIYPFSYLWVYATPNPILWLLTNPFSGSAAYTNILLVK